jgi:hypothetical protein
MSLSTSSIHSSLSRQQGNGGQDNRLKRKIGRQEVVLADMKVCRLVDWILDTLNPMLCRIVSKKERLFDSRGVLIWLRLLSKLELIVLVLYFLGIA